MTESSMVPLSKGELARFENSSITLRGEQTGSLDTLSTFEFETVQVDSTGRVVQRQTKTRCYFREDLGNGVMLDMVSIPDGNFKMGSPEDEAGRLENEGPQRWVKVPPLFMGRYPVTQVQWRMVATLPRVKQALETDPSRYKGDNCPVERVSWYNAMEFCARLSAHTGRQYRLPTEAEWEYACRAGTATPFHFGNTITIELANYYGWDDEIGDLMASYDEDDEDEEDEEDEVSGSYRNRLKGEDEVRDETTPVDHFGIANAFGLCDMHGNVWEWCQDHWHDSYKGAPRDGSAWIAHEEDAKEKRVLRGGSWDDYPASCRSAVRCWDAPDNNTNDLVGFRVVCGGAR